MGATSGGVVGSSVTPVAPQPNSPIRGPGSRGIAQTERVVLFVFGWGAALVGFVALLLHRLPNVVQFGAGLSFLAVGAGLIGMGVRPGDSADSADLSPVTLLAIERLALVPPAVVIALGCGVVLFDGGVGWGAKLLVVTGGLMLAGVLWALIVGNRLPDASAHPPTPDRPLPDDDGF